MGSAGGLHGLRIGVTPWLDDGDGAARVLAGQAERAEALGFDSFWLPESHFTGRGAIPAPLLPLAAVAARTERLRLGTTSFLLPLRHPLHVAEEVAVLDRLSGGRVILGVGRGFRRAAFAAFGVPPAEKRDRFESALEAILAAWRGEPVAFEPAPDAAAADAERGSGRVPVRLAPLPVQQPHPPLWVAAFGAKALEQAGGLGLPYLASPIEPRARLLENHARHRDALAASGHAAATAVPVMRTLFATRSKALAARVRDALVRQLAALAKAPVASLRQAAAAPLDELALVGEPEAVREGVARYREELGMTHLIARAQVPGASPEELEASLELLAGLVA